MSETPDNFRIITKTSSGLEEVLLAEIIGLGGRDAKIIKRGVECTGDLELLYSLNFKCRTAIKVIRPIAEFKAENEQELYDRIREIPWENYLETTGTFSIDSNVSYSNFNHSHFVSLKTKDAIADRFRSLYNSRPNVSLENPDLPVDIRIFRNQCTVSLNSTGESLHKRGYRISSGPAIISEVLAAGLVLLTGWNKEGHFIDPMCGTGTIVIEAALYANDIPPGIYRQDYAFMHWKDFDKVLWTKVSNFKIPTFPVFQHQIIGSDRSFKALQAARENIRNAGLSNYISIEAGNIETFTPPEGPGVLITNPPYGLRMPKEDIIAFYKSIGDAFKKQFTGYKTWVISSDKDALKHLGLHASRKHNVFNGQLDCGFFCYSIYEGSKKKSYEFPREEEQTNKPKITKKISFHEHDKKNRRTDFRR